MITKREKMFLENFLMTKMGDRMADTINFQRDLEMYNYPHKSELRKIFFKLYDKSWEETKRELTKLKEAT